MTLEALDNFEKDLEKARKNLDRLGDDLDAVRAEAQDEAEALRDVRRTDTALYKAIRGAYLQEMDEANGDKVDQHCQGIVSAIKAIYNFGYATGYTAGSQDTEERLLG